MTRAELSIYEEADSDPEVTFPKLASQQPAMTTSGEYQHDIPIASREVTLQLPASNCTTDDVYCPSQSLLEYNHASSPSVLQSVPEGNLCHAVPIDASNDVPQSSMVKLINSLCESVQRTQLPKLELSVLCGDPLEFQQWSVSFKRLVEDVTSDPSHRLHYLIQHTAGDAQTLFSAYSLYNTAEGYKRAMEELVKEYGDPYVLARAYLKKIESWPQVKFSDISGMHSFMTFLKKCRGSMQTQTSMTIRY